ncbi:hypothetical protein G9A89_008468 [Geosiphon pyriformis]|nr:hypothetical protein G9A89_008468 [Geosiphon pyriformis]
MNNSSSIGEVAIDIIHNISNTIDNDEITVRGSFPRSHTKESSVDPTDIGLLKHKRQSPHEDLFLCNRDLEKNKISSYNLKGENNRFVILLDDDDCDGINEMRRWQESDENNSKTMEDIIEKFKNRYKVADALARILYNDPFPDFILKFKNEIADDISTNTSIRNQFELLLLKTGLIVEHEDDSILKNFTYLKVWVPFYKLCDAADQMRLKVRLITKDNQIICKQKVEKNRLHQFFTKSFLRHINHQKRSAFFKKDRLREFEGADLEKEWSHIALNFWKGSRRNLLAQHLIINANVIQRKVQSADLNIPNFYQKQRIRQFSIENLLNQEVYVGFFPLHDGLLNKGSNTEPRNQRTFLYRNWVKSSDFQPLDEVRDYFGEKYGMYFAWLGLYTTWLLVATILGCITVLYGLIVVASKSYFKNGVAGISLIWDNALTFPFAVVMSIWGTCFLESWKRYNAALVHDWDLGEFEEEEQLSPDFNGTAIRQSMITSKQELYYPLQKRYKKLFFTSSVIVISMGIVLLTIGSLLTFSRFWFHEGVWNNVLASLVNLVTVLIMDVAYFYIAKWLTQVENHRTLASYEG